MKNSQKNPSYIQLAHTKEWVPKVEAIGESMTVYTEFAYNLGCMEDLAVLSAALRSDNPDIAAKNLLSEDVLDRLIRRDYFTDLLGSLATRVTLKSQVATNMVVPEIEDGTISGYLEEPFMGREMFPELHDAYLKNLEIRRQKGEAELAI